MVKESQPIKIYKPIVSVAMMAVLHVAGAALFVYAMAVASSDMRWWHWPLFVIFVVMTLHWAGQWLSHIKDRIVVSKDSLLLTNAERKRKHGDWVKVRNMELPWNNIKGFESTSEEMGTEYIFQISWIRRWIEISVRGGVTYRISPDLYDTFRLKKKLQQYWKQWRNK